jgi:hypothetical protein
MKKQVIALTLTLAALSAFAEDHADTILSQALKDDVTRRQYGEIQKIEEDYSEIMKLNDELEKLNKVESNAKIQIRAGGSAFAAGSGMGAISLFLLGTNAIDKATGYSKVFGPFIKSKDLIKVTVVMAGIAVTGYIVKFKGEQKFYVVKEEADRIRTIISERLPKVLEQSQSKLNELRSRIEAQKVIEE